MSPVAALQRPCTLVDLDGAHEQLSLLSLVASQAKTAPGLLQDERVAQEYAKTREEVLRFSRTVSGSCLQFDATVVGST